MRPRRVGPRCTPGSWRHRRRLRRRPIRARQRLRMRLRPIRYRLGRCSMRHPGLRLLPASPPRLPVGRTVVRPTRAKALPEMWRYRAIRQEGRLPRRRTGVWSLTARFAMHRRRFRRGALPQALELDRFRGFPLRPRRRVPPPELPGRYRIPEFPALRHRMSQRAAVFRLRAECLSPVDRSPALHRSVAARRLALRRLVARWLVVCRSVVATWSGVCRLVGSRRWVGSARVGSSSVGCLVVLGWGSRRGRRGMGRCGKWLGRSMFRRHTGGGTGRRGMGRGGPVGGGWRRWCGSRGRRGGSGKG